jgi:hypothetical protein
MRLITLSGMAALSMIPKLGVTAILEPCYMQDAVSDAEGLEGGQQ